MKTISLCMIVKDEEKILDRCLSSISDIMDEIIIVDTGSTDNTKNIAYKYTDKVYDFEWVNDFAKARNYSFSKATRDYIMWLDADDVILQEDYIKLKKLKEEMDGTVDVYMLNYNYAQDELGNCTIMQKRERILKRDKDFKWVSPIHEVIAPSGKIVDVDITITHKKEEIKDIERNLKIFKQMIENGEEFDDRQEYAYAKELYYLKYYEEAKERYELFIEKYKDNYRNIVDFMNSAVTELSECYKILNVSEEKRLELLFFMLKNTKPIPECCCKIADIFLDKKDYNTAIFWYEMAKYLGDGFKGENMDYNEFTPNISIGVCYYWLNDIENAIKYNELAGKIRPTDETYLRNKAIYMEKIKN